MAKAPAGAAHSDAAASLRAIPSVERILSAARFAPLIAEWGREPVKAAVVAHLDALRADAVAWNEDDALHAIGATLAASLASTLRPAINASGIIIHTNLGRAPIDDGIWADAAAIVTGYSNLEFDLEAGERGARDEHLSALCRTLFGCEAAVLTNNNAAGTMLLLAATAAGREVIVSRGELVEIGGAFRVPDVIQQGGAKLREVGTTNRTRARDYADAIGKKTAAILRVHRSNFDIVGFTETPEVAELVEVARAKRVPLLYDEGSGRAVDLARYGFAPRATLRELLTQGVDAITCSTDKLLGATQGGLILGSEAIVARCRKHPLMRAVRAGKETYAVVAATLRAFASGKHEERIAIYRMLATPIEELRARAERLVRGTRVRVVETRCALGGGTTPTETIASIGIEVPGDANALQTRFLRNDPPIVGRIHDGRFTLDVRTLLERDLGAVARALSAEP
ncbi:MAG: L-seryl-tRNA(Sec) selenium transferase [Acidobacteria bacterium]|nr:L-seryl-tRNA(Sec) selenium transferase [Acidobacteriota bacterium]MBV9476542.1 L-seryl-tRNA(Sec) selenium transferase [Acidobacteriota bacterium]